MLRFRDSPCRGCVEPKRHQGCHGKCTEYQNHLKEFEAFKKQIEEAKSQDRLYKDYKNKLFSKAYYKQQMKKKR